MRRHVAVLTALVSVVAVAVPALAVPEDLEKPKVAITTESGSVLVAVPPEVPAPPGDIPRFVTGTATDDFSGISAVRVFYCGGARQESGAWTCGGVLTPPIDPTVSRSATVTCTNATRRSCSWSVMVPDTPGSYLVVVTATDKVNKEQSAGPIHIVVV